MCGFHSNGPSYFERRSHFGIQSLHHRFHFSDPILFILHQRFSGIRQSADFRSASVHAAEQHIDYAWYHDPGCFSQCPYRLDKPAAHSIPAGHPHHDRGHYGQHPRYTAPEALYALGNQNRFRRCRGNPGHRNGHPQAAFQGQVEGSPPDSSDRCFLLWRMRWSLWHQYVHRCLPAANR